MVNNHITMILVIVFGPDYITTLKVINPYFFILHYVTPNSPCGQPLQVSGNFLSCSIFLNLIDSGLCHIPIGSPVTKLPHMVCLVQVVFPNKLNGVSFVYQAQGDTLPSTSI